MQSVALSLLNIKDDDAIGITFSLVANRRRDVYQFFEIFPTSPELIRTPKLINFQEKNL